MIEPLNKYVDKIILLHASQEIATLIRDARYLGILNQYASKILLSVSSPDLVRDLLEFSFDRLKVISENTATDQLFDFALDMECLPSLLQNDGEPQSQSSAFPYLKVPDKAIPISTGDKYRLGMAFYGAEKDSDITSEVIVYALPIQKLHNSSFMFFPQAHHVDGRIPDCFECIDAGEQVKDYSDIAALVASLDIVIGFENDVTHLAGALGKPVWLLTPVGQNGKQSSFSDYYPLVSTFYRGVDQTWEQILRNLFLYQSLKPSEALFVPFNTREISLSCLSSGGARPFPDLLVENTGQLQSLFDLDLTDITSVTIETTTVCNLRCPYCPHSTPVAKTPAYMPDQLFYRIIDSLAEFNPEYDGQIIPSMYGEPLLDKRLETFVSYARQRFPLAQIDLFTNGTFLTVERYSSLKKAGIHRFNVSVHTPEMSRELCQTLSVIQDEFDDFDKFNLIHMYNSNKFNRGGLVEGTPPDRAICQHILRCDAGSRNIVFDHKGDAILCCNDYLAQNKFGNIENESIRQIWNKPAYRKTRNELLYGYLPLKLCRVCLSHV